MRLLAAELRKLATLPGVWIGAAVSLLVPAGFVIIAARQAAHYGGLPDADDGYGQLALHTAPEVRTGSEDGAEMGVFESLKQPQRETNLRTRLDEYMPFGLEAGLIYVT